jgi:hypothetical protein
MFDTIQRWLFNPAGLTPHGFCLAWEPGLIWLHALADVAIGSAYFTIPFALMVFVRKRQDLVFRPVFGLFAAFIFLCGTGHWLNLLTLWVPAYGMEGVVKAMTGVAGNGRRAMAAAASRAGVAVAGATQARQRNAAGA